MFGVEAVEFTRQKQENVMNGKNKKLLLTIKKTKIMIDKPKDTGVPTWYR